MIEEVFGEFRPMIIEMRAALYDEDTSRVRRLLAEMEHSMFADGIWWLRLLLLLQEQVWLM